MFSSSTEYTTLCIPALVGVNVHHLTTYMMDCAMWRNDGFKLSASSIINCIFYNIEYHIHCSLWWEVGDTYFIQSTEERLLQGLELSEFPGG